MAFCTRCWRQARPKFKQHCLALYPDLNEEQKLISQSPELTNTQSVNYSLFTDPIAQPRGLSDLTYYAQMYPNRLPRIGRYLLKKLKQYNQAGNPRFVHLSMMALIGLVDACHSDEVLVLFDESVCQAIKLLLTHPNYEHRILAAQSLNRLMSFIDDAADFRKYEQFFDLLINLCRSSDPSLKPAVNQAIRVAGLQGMNAMVVHFYPARLVDHFNQIIPSLLDNINQPNNQLTIHTANQPHDQAIDPESLAIDTLTLLASRVSIPDLDSALQPIFQSMDAHQWLPINRSALIVQLIANSSASDLGDLVLFELLKHALVIGNQPAKQVAVTRTSGQSMPANILSVSATLIQSMRVNVLHWEGMCDLLIHHVVSNVQSNSPAISQPACLTINQSAIEACFVAYAEKLPLAQDVISLLFHLTQQIYHWQQVTYQSTPQASNLYTNGQTTIRLDQPNNQVINQPVYSSNNPTAQLASRMTYEQREQMIDSLVDCLIGVSIHWTCDMSAVDGQVFTSLASTDCLIRSLLAIALFSNQSPSQVNHQSVTQSITQSGSHSNKQIMNRMKIFHTINNLLMSPGLIDDTDSENDPLLMTNQSANHSNNQSINGHSSINHSFKPTINQYRVTNTPMTKSHRFLQSLFDQSNNQISSSNDTNWLHLDDKEQRWILTVLYYELTASISQSLKQSINQQVTSPTSADTTNNHTINQTSNKTINQSQTRPGSISPDGIQITMHQSPNQSIVLGSGVTDAQCFVVAFPLMISMMHHSVNQSIGLQWPMIVALNKFCMDQSNNPATSPSINQTVNRIQMFIFAWLFAVARLIDCPSIEQIVNQLIDQQSDWSDLTFDTDSPQSGLQIISSANQSISQGTFQQRTFLPIERLTDLLIQSMVEPKSHQSLSQSIKQELIGQFEPFNLKFLPPSKLTDEERENSWAPSVNQSLNQSIDDSLTRLESPFMSPRINQANSQAINPIRNTEDEMKSANASTSQPINQSIDDSSFAAVASMCNRNSTRFEQQFRQSMRLFVDSTLDQAQSANHSSDPVVTPQRRGSLSSHRRSAAADLPMSNQSVNSQINQSMPSTTGATSDKFFAAPAVVAPPTLNVQAAIRQQIESSYAVSPSHAVSGSVNIKATTEPEDQSINPATNRSLAGTMNGALSLNGTSSSNQLGTPQRTARRVSTSNSRSSRDGDMFGTTQLTNHTINQAFDADSLVYGLSDDGEGIAHIEGTSDNILKFHFPKLNTFDSYLPAELDG